MSISVNATGTVANSDLQMLQIFRATDGTLTAKVTYIMTNFGGMESRTAEWSLSAAEKTAIAGLLPGAITAIENELGLP